MQLRKIRRDKDVSQKELADILKVSQNTISQWETNRNKIDYENLIKIANYFNITVDYLIGRVNTIPTSNLNGTEQQIIQDYRQLPTHLQEKLTAYLQGLTESILTKVKER